MCMHINKFCDRVGLLYEKLKVALYGRTNTSSEQKAVAHILFFDQTLTWACCWKINEGKTEQCHVPNLHAHPVATELNLAKTARFMSTDCYLHPQRAATPPFTELWEQLCPCLVSRTAHGVVTVLLKDVLFSTVPKRTSRCRWTWSCKSILSVSHSHINTINCSRIKQD